MLKETKITNGHLFQVTIFPINCLNFLKISVSSPCFGKPLSTKPCIIGHKSENRKPDKLYIMQCLHVIQT